MSRAQRIHIAVASVMLLVMTVELAILIYNTQWLHVFLVLSIMAITILPLMPGRRFQVQIPSEFQLMTILFVFASLFLGEIRSYYERFWWWDIVLHTTSGLLLGIVGFLLVYVLNENRRVNLTMRPHFVAFFAFVFAVSVGALWEIFEFTMDQLLGMNMQKAMFNDPSGLTDTMWDLIVDTVGAAIISLFGWWYMRRNEPSFIDQWVRKFIDANPRMFRR